MENEPNYFAIITANVRYNKNLSDKAKLLYGEITALCSKKGYCWATNQYFADLYEVHKNTISRIISQLKQEGYIFLEFIYQEGTKNIEERHIYINNPINKNVNTPKQNCLEPINKNVNTPINKNVKDNNTFINNTINNYIDPIFEYWSELEIMKHKKESVKNHLLSSSGYLKKKYKTIFDIHGIDQIKKAIKNYSHVLESSNHYWDHKWPLWDFLTRGLERFLDSADPLTNFQSDGAPVKKNYEENYMNQNQDYLKGLG